MRDFVFKCNKKSGRRDSNSQQPAWKAGILPLSYFRIHLLFNNIIKKIINQLFFNVAC